MSPLTRTLLTTGAMLIGVAAAAAQAPAVRRAVFTRSPAAMLERLFSLDVNADGRITRDELPERMHDLVARGDSNADAALDADEIRALVNAASPQPTRLDIRRPAREALLGVIRDLKLPPPKDLRAFIIVGGHKLPFHVNDSASTALLREMRALLDDEEYENFVAAATRLSRSADRFGTVGGGVGGVPQPVGSR